MKMWELMTASVDLQQQFVILQHSIVINVLFPSSGSSQLCRGC